MTQEIQDYVDELLNNLNKKEFKGEAINWGDLSCSVEATILITIEEAAPGCTKLNSYIYGKLKEKYPNKHFNVITEW
jgi:hypothetical protein